MQSYLKQVDVRSRELVLLPQRCSNHRAYSPSKTGLTPDLLRMALNVLTCKNLLEFSTLQIIMDIKSYKCSIF